jgi:hypothetical protein
LYFEAIDVKTGQIIKLKWVVMIRF